MRKPTLATRFNSISSAVGPLVIDNVMKEAKLDNFREVSNNSVFCTADGASIDINYLFDKHPNLKAFYNAYSISQRIFADTPVGSNTFQDLLNTFPKDIKGTLLKDKKLLNKFSDFYSSYLVIQSGLVDQENLKEMIEEFPKTFNQKYKKNKEYKDNPLIQAIQLDTQKGKVVLSIKLTGMDSQEKDLLSSGWTDLHNQDPELSKKLFDYCFFRAGIGFSPKTFMSLVPVYVKERLKSADGKVSYVDTFRKIPSVELQNVVTQFIRNNWNEYKIVPLIKDGNFIYDWNINQIRVEDPVTRKQCKTYIRTKVGKEEHLWVKDPGLSTDDYDTYRHIEPLGNNGEYLEISKEEIVEAMQKTTATSEETETPIEEESTPESNIESPHPTEPSKESLQEQMLQMMAVALPGDDRATILRKYTEARASVLAGQTAYGVFLQNVALKNGYKLDKAGAIEWFKKFC